MIVGAIILSVILLVIMWMIFVPVNIRVNSAAGLYEIRQPGTIRTSWHPGEIPSVRMQVFGFSIDMQRREGEPHRRSVRRQSGTPGERKRKSFASWLDFLHRLSRSFQCRRFVCNVDFDDVVLNAQLLPVGYLISRGPVVVHVNFEKKYLLDVWIQARVHRILWAFMRFHLTK